MKYILFVLFSLSIAEAFSCDCKPFSKYDEYQIASSIFLAEVVLREENRFQIKVLESFKGDDDFTWIEIDDCSVSPNKGEIWLLYLTMLDGKSHVSVCGYSRNSAKPFYVNLFHKHVNQDLPPPPLLGDEELADIQHKILRFSLDEYYQDLNFLRYTRLQNVIVHSQDQQSQLENKIEIVIWLCVVTLVLLFVFIIIWYMNVKTKS